MEFKLKKHTFSKTIKSMIYEYGTMEHIRSSINSLEYYGYNIVDIDFQEMGFDVSTLEKCYWCKIKYTTW